MVPGHVRPAVRAARGGRRAGVLALRASRLPSQEVVVVNMIDDIVGYVGLGFVSL